MRRHELSDARWAQIADLMPRNRGRGGGAAGCRRSTARPTAGAT